MIFQILNKCVTLDTKTQAFCEQTETAILELKRVCNKKVFTCPRTRNVKTVYNILRFSGEFMPFIEKGSSVKLSAKSELT